MKRMVRIAAALAACASLYGCAASPPASKKEEPSAVSIRLPVVDAATMSIESEPTIGRPDLPLSVADESRDRWLTVFEVNYSPVKPPLPPLPIVEEEPSR